MADRLRDKQQVFLDHYFRTWNAAASARAAGYHPPYNVAGAKVLHSPTIQALVREMMQESGVTEDLIRFQLAEISRASIEDFLNIDAKTGTVSFDLQKARETGTMRFAKKIVIRGGVVVSVEMVDVLKALDMLAQLMGLYSEPTKSSPSNNDRAFWEGK
jgi:phage terminase small subunit